MLSEQRKRTERLVICCLRKEKPQVNGISRYIR